MKAATAIPASWADIHEAVRRSLATSLRRDGIELGVAVGGSAAPGTPVYVEAPVNISEVRRFMARAHCQIVPVLQQDLVIGLIDLPSPQEPSLRLERIVANLVSNAIDHGRENVRVRAGKDAAHIYAEVADDGPGIPSEHLAHVFDRFYKVDPARSGGSGLGLSIAAENATLLGGTIDVSSDPGKGTRFVVRLPCDWVVTRR